MQLSEQSVDTDFLAQAFNWMDPSLGTGQPTYAEILIDCAQ